MWSLAFFFLKIAQPVSKIIQIQKVREIVINYNIKWSRIDNQKVDCSIISMGVMSSTKVMASTKSNAQTSTNWGHKFLYLSFLKYHDMYISLLTQCAAIRALINSIILLSSLK